MGAHAAAVRGAPALSDRDLRGLERRYARTGDPADLEALRRAQARAATAELEELVAFARGQGVEWGERSEKGRAAVWWRVLRAQPSTFVSTLRGPFDSESVEVLLRLHDAWGRSEAALVLLDVSRVHFLSSTSLGILTRWGDAARGRGGALVVVGIRPKIRVVIEMLGLNAFFTLREGWLVEEAAELERGVALETILRERLGAGDAVSADPLATARARYREDPSREHGEGFYCELRFGDPQAPARVRAAAWLGEPLAVARLREHEAALLLPPGPGWFGAGVISWFGLDEGHGLAVAQGRFTTEAFRAQWGALQRERPRWLLRADLARWQDPAGVAAEVRCVWGHDGWVRVFGASGLAPFGVEEVPCAQAIRRLEDGAPIDEWGA